MVPCSELMYSVILEVLFHFYLWDQSRVTIVWNTRETGDNKYSGDLNTDHLNNGIVITYSWKEVYPQCASLTKGSTIRHETLGYFGESFEKGTSLLSRNICENLVTTKANFSPKLSNKYTVFIRTSCTCTSHNQLWIFRCTNVRWEDMLAYLCALS